MIPFKLDKKAAKQGLQNYIAKKRLLPKIFKDENHIDEIKGVYVPFWLFDSEADAKIRELTGLDQVPELDTEPSNIHNAAPSSE